MATVAVVAVCVSYAPIAMTELWPYAQRGAPAFGAWGAGACGVTALCRRGRRGPAAFALAVVLGVRAAEVDWSSGPALSLVTMVAGLLLAGTVGHRLPARSLATQP